MEDQVARLVDKAWDRFLERPPDRRLIIAIAGIPGSGKTTLASVLTKALNTRHAALHGPGAPPVTAFVPMDGYHLTRAQLSAMPDPANAHARRGAEFTFDGAGFLRLVRALREPLGPATADVLAPSFDHAVKDPKEDDIAVHPTHRIVVLEGLYVLLDQEPWRSAAALTDERWFVEVNFSVARRRLARRHLAAGIVADLEAGDQRAVGSDLVNGEQIVRLRLPVDEVVTSREDGRWVHE
ncbi:P-loop containing nucleoside triphosphate hydrolase protein [Lasiosphaeria miniovina]|uniref:P-loop containing nucleoside triphosphate hydrolase protein n=1 Tax=Lasiosphaeria miniovina TaxID=1954250 RepID=A0AA40B3L2_9PEZI|nr:P-loop containing nucleoside triphosphate hydrolase protein [Lasiosphaeria miniovina]KAK0727032.1 P-loop containing nucleoside triphosphate hydrolase protein [Lasiosphaeria miniovina]